MAIRDALCLLSDAQAVTADAVSTNSYDSAAAGNEIGIGEPLALVITVDVAADSTTGDETYVFEFIESAAAALTSPTVLVERAVAAASLTAGAQVVLPLPPDAKSKRYLGAQYDVGGTTPTITVTAFIAPLSSVQNYKAYADAITIN